MSVGEDLRIGVIVPAGNTVHEDEFARLRPAGVQFKFQGFSYPPGSEDFCTGLIPRMTPSMQAFKAWGAELVLVGCTTAAMMCGGEGFAQALEDAAGAPIVTAADAGREVMAAWSLKTISIATPYGAANNGVVEDFVRASGVKVAALKGLDLDRTLDAWIAGQPTLTPDLVFDLSLAADRPQAQALYLPCTGMRSLEAIDRFEAVSGKPAFSSVQAGYWASLRRLGFDGRREGAGRLLQHWDF